MGIFGKTKIREKEAATAFIITTMREAAEAWPHVVSQLDPMGRWTSRLQGDRTEAVHFAAAVLALESQAIGNLLLQEQAQRIMAHILTLLKAISEAPDVPDDPLTDFVEYCKGFAEAIAVKEMPHDALGSILYDRLGIEGALLTIGGKTAKVKDWVFVKLLAMAIVEVSGGWWKSLLAEYKLVQ
jgi:hypothetical protein